MHFDATILNSVLSGLILLVVSWGLKVMSGLKDQLSKINGRVTASETWAKGHEKSDDERHEHLEKANEALWKRLDRVQGA